MTTSANERVISHHIGPDGSLSVRVATWDVDIVGTDGVEARIRNASGGELPGEIEVERGDGSLRVGQPSRLGGFGLGMVFGSGRGDLRLALEVPSGARVSVHSASGDVSTRGIAGSQEVRSASGDVQVFAASGEIIVETVSGDAAIDLDGTARVTTKSVSGDVRLEGGRIERLAVVTTSGGIRVASALEAGSHSMSTLSGDVLVAAGSDIRVIAKTVSGDLSSDLPHRSEGAPGRRSIVIGNGAAEIQFKSVSGDLRVVGRDPDDRSFAIPVEAPPHRPEPPELPSPPRPTVPPEPPEPPLPPTGGLGAGSEPLTAEVDEVERARLAILQQLERGEIDVAEATVRLAQLEEQA